MGSAASWKRSERNMKTSPTRSRREINCPERKIRSLGVTYFAKTGKPLDAAIDSQTEWHAIEQTAVIEGLHQMVCKKLTDFTRDNAFILSFCPFLRLISSSQDHPSSPIQLAVLPDRLSLKFFAGLAKNIISV